MLVGMVSADWTTVLEQPTGFEGALKLGLSCYRRDVECRKKKVLSFDIVAEKEDRG